MSDSPTTTDASSGGEVESELSPTASGSDSLPRITPPLSSPKHTHARTHARTHNETGVRGLKKSVKELELSLLQLQQDVHIPRVVLSPHTRQSHLFFSFPSSLKYSGGRRLRWSW